MVPSPEVASVTSMRYGGTNVAEADYRGDESPTQADVFEEELVGNGFDLYEKQSTKKRKLDGDTPHRQVRFADQVNQGEFGDTTFTTPSKTAGMTEKKAKKPNKTKGKGKAKGKGGDVKKELAYTGPIQGLGFTTELQIVDYDRAG